MHRVRPLLLGCLVTLAWLHVGCSREPAHVHRLRVVLADGSPAAGAEVWYQEVPPDSDRRHETEAAELARLAAQDLEGYLRRIGTRTVADARGEVELPTRAEGSAVVARLGDRYGALWLRSNTPETAEQTLLLHPDRELVVRVIDLDAEPVAGVEVQLLQPGPDAQSPTNWRPLGVSDPAGIVRQPHFESATGSSRLRAHVVGAEPVTVDIDPLAPPRVPVELRVPKCGRLQLRLLDPEGQPTRCGPSAHVQLARIEADALAAQAEELMAMAPDWPQEWRRSFRSDGSIEYPAVALGKSLLADVGAGTAFRQTFLGPDARTPSRAVDLRMPADTVTLVGLVVAETGLPLGEESFRLSISSEGLEHHLAALTAPDGRLQVHLPRELAGAQPTVTLMRSVDPMQRAVVVLREPLRAGRNGLGEVSIGPAPLLVSGRVRWRDGTPFTDLPLRVEARPRTRRGQWRTAVALRPIHLGDGRFEVRGRVARVGLRLQVRGDAHVPVAPISFTPGTSGIEIVLERGGTATVTFRVDDATPWGALKARLEPQDSVDPPTNLPTLRAAAQPVDPSRVRAEFRGLATGSYRLTVRCPGVDPPVAEISGIDVLAGKAVDDHRLREVDLRGSVRRFAIAVVGARDQPLVDSRCAVLYRGAGDVGSWHGASLQKHPVQVVAPGSVDLLVAGPGYCTLSRTDVREATTLRLSLAPRFTIRIQPPPPPLPVDYRLELDMQPQDESAPVASEVVLETGQRLRLARVLGHEVMRVDLDYDGRATLPARGSSVWTVALRVFRGQGIRRGRKTVEGTRPTQIDLRTVVDGQEFVLDVPAAALAAAIAALDK